jgi:opacity protein-like surface antigen
MKKKILITLLLFVSVGASAQLIKDTNRISWNAKMGMNFSYIDVDNSDARVGYYVGVGMEYHFTDTWSLQPSLLLTSKGSKLPDNCSITANYMELPIMAAARLKLTEHVNLVISTGPYVAVGVGGSFKQKVNGVQVSFGTFKSITAYGESLKFMNRFDAGIGAGLAAEFGPFAIALDGKFGLADVGGRIKSEELTGDFDFKNTNFSLGIGYKF